MPEPIEMAQIALTEVPGRGRYRHEMLAILSRVRLLPDHAALRIDTPGDLETSTWGQYLRVWLHREFGKGKFFVKAYTDGKVYVAHRNKRIAEEG